MHAVSILLLLALALMPMASQETGFLGVYLGGDDEAAVLQGIVEGSPAAQAGLQGGDEVVAFNDEAIDNTQQLRNRLSSSSAGTQIELTVVRQGEEQRIKVTLGSRATREITAEPQARPAPHVPVITVPEVPSQPTQRQPAFLGVHLADGEDGVAVGQTVEDSPADHAGIQTGDVIVAIDGKETGSVEDLRAILAAKRAGDKVTVQVMREGQAKKLKVELGAVPNVAEAEEPSGLERIPEIQIPEIEIPEMDIPEIEIHEPGQEDDEPQEDSAFLGVMLSDGEGGALVESVVEGSPAESAGLQSGDVIVRFDDREIGSAQDLVEAVGAHEPGERVRVRLLRDGEESSIRVRLGTREESMEEEAETEEEEEAAEEEEEEESEDDVSVFKRRPAQEDVQRQQAEARRQAAEARRQADEARRQAEKQRQEIQRQVEQSRRQAERMREEAQRQAEQSRRQAERHRQEAQRRAEAERRAADDDRRPALRQREQGRSSGEEKVIEFEGGRIIIRGFEGDGGGEIIIRIGEGGTRIRAPRGGGAMIVEGFAEREEDDAPVRARAFGYSLADGKAPLVKRWVEKQTKENGALRVPARLRLLRGAQGLHAMPSTTAPPKGEGESGCSCCCCCCGGRCHGKGGAEAPSVVLRGLGGMAGSSPPAASDDAECGGCEQDADVEQGVSAFTWNVPSGALFGTTLDLSSDELADLAEIELDCELEGIDLEGLDLEALDLDVLGLDELDLEALELEGLDGIEMLIEGCEENCDEADPGKDVPAQLQSTDMKLLFPKPKAKKPEKKAETPSLFVMNQTPSALQK